MATTATTQGATVTTSASTRIFAIFELAEQILLELPMRDLLVHQRTCRQWQAVMVESAKLQQAMFFNSATFRTLVIHEGRSHTGSRNVLSHPLFGTPMRPLEDVRGALERPEASWRRQLITQPPVAEVYAYMRCATSLGPKVTITARGLGVTMGDVARVFGSYRASEVHFRGDGAWRKVEWKRLAAWKQVQAVKGVEYEGLWSWGEDEESESGGKELEMVDDVTL